MILAEIKAAGALVRCQTEPLDTGSSMGTFMLQILGVVAELDRGGIIRERSIARQQAARDCGVHCGRSLVLSPEDEAEAVRLYATGEYTLRPVAQIFDVSESIVKRAIYRLRKPRHSSLR